MAKEIWYADAIPKGIDGQKINDSEGESGQIKQIRDIQSHKPLVEALVQAADVRPDLLLQELNNGLELEGRLYPRVGIPINKNKFLGMLYFLTELQKERDQENARNDYRRTQYIQNSASAFELMPQIKACPYVTNWGLVWTKIEIDKECLHGYPIEVTRSIDVGIPDDGTHRFYVAIGLDEPEIESKELVEKSGPLWIKKMSHQVFQVPIEPLDKRINYEYTDKIDSKQLKTLLIRAVKNPTIRNISHKAPYQAGEHVGFGGGGFGSGCGYGHGCGYGCGH